MAVYTPLTQSDVENWISEFFELGTVVHFEGIASGIENSNFFVDLEKEGIRQSYVLTIFERLSATQLPYYLELMQFLAKQGILVPSPQVSKSGSILQEFKGKPTTLVSKLSGKSLTTPNAAHCEQVGDMLAKLHLAGQTFSMRQPNLRSLSWWKESIPQILPHVNTEIHALLNDELNAQTHFFDSFSYFNLPAGPCHCDLFRDNVLFKMSSSGDALSGFFDFYFAGTDKWLFDVAVTVNDWCIDHATGEFNPEHLSAFLHAYQAIRPFHADELEAWPMMLRTAAFRFWVSRLWDYYLPRDAQMLTAHDPTHFERILKLRRSYAY